MLAVMRASRRKRARALGTSAQGPAMNFTATVVPRTRCSAAQTEPMPPSANLRTKRNVPDST